MAKVDSIYYIPSGIDKEIAEVIVKSLKKYPLEKAITTVESDTYSRNSQVLFLNTDNWIAGMLAHFIHSANNVKGGFNYDLHSWANHIQYTVYDGPGTGYKWHIDHLESAFIPDHFRKLSISLCLSSKDDYDGGELQLLVGANRMKSYKMDCGDVLVFPSDYTHRVRPLKSGKRISLVGWMGGPKFK